MIRNAYDASQSRCLEERSLVTSSKLLSFGGSDLSLGIKIAFVSNEDDRNPVLVLDSQNLRVECILNFVERRTAVDCIAAHKTLTGSHLASKNQVNMAILRRGKKKYVKGSYILVTHSRIILCKTKISD